MQIEIITKSDIQSLEKKVDGLIATFQAKNTGSLGTVYTTKELSTKLKVSVKTINNWREARLIEFCKVNHTILYTEKAVSDFLAGHSIKRKSSLFNPSKSGSNE